MLVYLDSSVLARAYLPDEPGHAEAATLLYGVEHLLVTSSWTPVEVTSALARANRSGRAADLDALLGVMAQDLSEHGCVTLLRAEVDVLESRSAQIAREHLLRSLDALHLAVADLAARPLVAPGEQLGFASRDDAQSAAAEAMGFVRF